MLVCNPFNGAMPGQWVYTYSCPLLVDRTEHLIKVERPEHAEITGSVYAEFGTRSALNPAPPESGGPTSTR